VDAPKVRRAQVSDIPELLRLRGVMFESMGYDVSESDWMVSATARLKKNLPLSLIIGAAAPRGPGLGLCAAGLLDVREILGSPRFPMGNTGHIYSVAVDPQWRRRGIGESVLRFLIDEARTAGLERVELHATPEAEPMYRRLGFHDRGGPVELRLEL
jgi:ribosomal protein S18 acetylase RimI-like enzyme